jgi:hypothetical protein
MAPVAVALNSTWIDGSRLEITGPNSHVTLKNATVSQGITIEAAATGAILELKEKTSVTAPRSAANALFVNADGASVILDGSGIYADPAATDSEAARFEGKGQSFSILGGSSSNVITSDGSPAIHVIGSTTLFVDDLARFIAPIVFDLSSDGLGGDATFQNAVFDRTMFTFHGRTLTMGSNTSFSNSLLTFSGETLTLNDTSFEGQGVVFGPPPSSGAAVGDANLNNVTFTGAHFDFNGHGLTIAGSTSFNASPLKFTGASLSVDHATFDGDGIEQDGNTSSSMLTNVSIKNYTQFGYHLLMGTVYIKDSQFVHGASANESMDCTKNTSALRVEAPGDSDSGVMSSGTTYDGLPPPTQDCGSGFVGPVASGTFLCVTQNVPLSLCE